MAAFFFSPDNGADIFKTIPIVSNVQLDFLSIFLNQNPNSDYTQPGFTGTNGMLIVSEVAFQVRDTIQYFLTFDDLITYYYFGKGLGTMTVSGSILADCSGTWGLYNNFMQYLGKLRGETIGQYTDIPGTNTDLENDSEQYTGHLAVGGVSLVGVLSSFTVRAGTEPNSLSTVDFTLQLDIIDSSFPKASIDGACY